MNLNFLYSALVVLFMLPPPLNAQHKGNKGHAPDNEGMENKSFNDHEWDEKFEKYFERWMENHGPDNHAQRRRARWPWWSVRGNITGDRAFIGTINANPLLFRTSDSLRLSISSSGDVEIFKNLTVNRHITGTSMQLSGLTGPGMLMVDEFGNIRMSNIGISKDTISINNLQTNNFYVKNNLQIGNTIYANVSPTSHDNFIYTDGTNLNIQRTPDGVTQTAGNLILCEKTADNDNNVGIKNNNPIYDLDVNGDINFSGSILKDGNELNMDGLWKPYSQVDAQGWMIEGTNNPFIGPAAKIIVEGGKMVPCK